MSSTAQTGLLTLAASGVCTEPRWRSVRSPVWDGTQPVCRNAADLRGCPPPRPLPLRTFVVAGTAIIGVRDSAGTCRCLVISIKRAISQHVAVPTGAYILLTMYAAAALGSRAGGSAGVAMFYGRGALLMLMLLRCWRALLSGCRSGAPPAQLLTWLAPAFHERGTRRSP